MKNTPNTIQMLSEQLFESFQRLMTLPVKKQKRGKPLGETEIKASSAAALEQFYGLARDLKKQRGLGVIASARVAFNLQQRLLAVGYETALVKQVLFAMLMLVIVNDKH